MFFSFFSTNFLFESKKNTNKINQTINIFVTCNIKKKNQNTIKKNQNKSKQNKKTKKYLSTQHVFCVLHRVNLCQSIYINKNRKQFLKHKTTKNIKTTSMFASRIENHLRHQPSKSMPYEMCTK